jgi:hypothetical protein
MNDTPTETNGRLSPSSKPLQIINMHDHSGITIAWVLFAKAEAGSRIRAKEFYLHCIIVERVV